MKKPSTLFNMRSFLKAVCRQIAAWMILFIIAAPFGWLVLSSFMTMQEIYKFPATFLPKVMQLQNYINAWNGAPFLRYFFNSIVVTMTILAAELITVTFAAYAFACLKFPGKNLIFLCFLGVMMIPRQVVILPSYLLLANLGWLDSYQALIVPFLSSAFGIFLLRQAFMQIPEELRNAAKIDGAGHLRTIFHIMLPLAKPIIAGFALLTFTWHWNDYFWPLIVTNTTEMRTVPIGIVLLHATEGGARWNVIMAGVTIAVLPLFLVFAFSQKHFVAGITRTGLKG